MAASGYTPILLYASGTTTNVPLAANLTSSASGAELALNYADGKLFYKDSGGVVQVLATKGTGPIGGSNTQVQYNSSGSLAGSSNLTFNGTTLTANTLNLTNALGTAYGGTGLTSFTANGVVYASSTSALTTGSALTFDGSKLTVKGGNAGQFVLDNTGQQYVQQIFQTNATANTGIDYLLDGTNNTFSFRGLAANMPFIWSLSATAGNPSEQMRLTSTGLGIGTSSPTQKLDVSGADGVRARVIASSAGTSGLILSSSGATAYTIKAGNADSSLRIDQDGTDRITLASGGNVGIGTSSPSAKLDVQAASGVVKLTSTTGTNNVYYQASNTGGGLYMGRDDSDGGSFYTGSPAYGAIFLSTGAYPMAFAIDGTERMRLDSSGNLGLGVTPSAWTGNTKALQFGNPALWADNYSGATNIGYNAYQDTNTTFKYLQTGLGAGRYEIAQNLHRWYNAPSGTAGNAITFTQAMTLGADGNLAVGNTSTSNARLFSYVNDASLPAIVARQDGAGPVQTWQTSGTERARIDSSGNLLVGTTTNTYSSRVVFYNASNTVLNTVTGSTGTSNQILFNNPNGIVGSITTNGSATLYNVTSDYRLKNIDGPVTNSGAFIDKLQPKQGSWKADGSRFIGLLAHELQEASETVVGTGIKDGEEMQSIDYANPELIANVVAELQSLRQRLAALEAA